MGRWTMVSESQLTAVMVEIRRNWCDRGKRFTSRTACRSCSKNRNPCPVNYFRKMVGYRKGEKVFAIVRPPRTFWQKVRFLAIDFCQTVYGGKR